MSKILKHSLTVSSLKKIGFFCITLLLSGCISTPKLVAPNAINYNNNTYYLVSQQDFGEIVRNFYVPKSENQENWHSGIELLQDKNREQRTLEDRIALRKRVYRNNGVKHFDLYRRENQLFSFVIYEPTEQNKDWQVDVALGKDMLFCGFLQYQYSLKVTENRKFMNMSKHKIINYLKKYIVDKEIQKLMKIDFSWYCKS